jgi:rod shape-determining protein MreC
MGKSKAVRPPTPVTARLQKLSAVESEIIKLRELFKSSNRLRREKALVADLLLVDLDPYKQYIVANKGALQGVEVGQALLDAYGVGHQVTHVNPISAIASLISDPNHALPVEINCNSMRMLAFGTDNPQTLSLRYIPTNADVKVGDGISTSGLGNRYPPKCLAQRPSVTRKCESRRTRGYPVGPAGRQL